MRPARSTPASIGRLMVGRRVVAVGGAVLALTLWVSRGEAFASEELGQNQSPTAVVGGPYAGEPREGLTFDGSASRDSDGTIVAYQWDFGDGGAVVNSGTDGAIVQHSYPTAGSYDVTLTIVDDAGTASTVATTAVIGAGSSTATPAPNPEGAVAAESVETASTLAAERDRELTSPASPVRNSQPDRQPSAAGGWLIAGMVAAAGVATSIWVRSSFRTETVRR